MFSTSDPRIDTSAMPSRLGSRDIPVWAPQRMPRRHSPGSPSRQSALASGEVDACVDARGGCWGVVASDLFSLVDWGVLEAAEHFL
jgi:hypothetical protein